MDFSGEHRACKIVRFIHVYEYRRPTGVHRFTR